MEVSICVCDGYCSTSFHRDSPVHLRPGLVDSAWLPNPPLSLTGLFMLQDFSQPDRLERETLRSNFKLHFYHTPWECLKMCLTTICFLQIYLQLLVRSQSTLRLLGWSYSLVNLALGKGFWSNLLNVWTGVLWKYLDWHPHEEYGGI